jgi:hypothetical protein
MLCCGDGVSSMSMSCSDVVTICGLFAVQCIYGLYMMFLSALLAAGVPSLFIIVVACAASSVVVLPFALALERYVRTYVSPFNSVELTAHGNMVMMGVAF